VTLVVVAAALALPAAAAYAALARCWRESTGDLSSRVLLAGLSVPLGLGAGSLFTYAWLVAGGTLGRAYVLADVILFATAIAVARPRGARARGRTGAAPTVVDRCAVAALVGTLVIVAAFLVQQAIIAPHGEWDAWAIWNQRARFLLRGGEQWRVAFADELAPFHPGYPLLVPTTVARLWAFAGETPIAPAAAAAAFTLAAPVVVFGAVSGRAGRVAGATAALLLLAAQTWLSVGANQYADVPLACLLGAAAASIGAARRADGSEDARILAVAGAFLGLATWTKNEGLVLAAVFAAWAVASPGAGSRRRRVLALAAGGAAPVVAVASFEAFLAPGFASVFTEGQTISGTLQRMLDPARWQVIVSAMPHHVPGKEVGLPAVAVVAAIVLGASWRELPRSAAVPALLSAAGYLLIYAATPLDLSWHIDRSASRLLVQTWPVFVLGVFQLVAPAGPALRPAETRAGAEPAQEARPPCEGGRS
jgi:hypothetical protein